MRHVAEARGMTNVAKGAQLNRVSMYPMLPEQGNPQLSSRSAVLQQLGLRLASRLTRPSQRDLTQATKQPPTTPSRGQGGGVFLPRLKTGRSPQGAGVGGRGRISGWLIPPPSTENPKTRRAAPQAWLPRDQPPVKEPPPTPSTRPSPPGARRASESDCHCCDRKSRGTDRGQLRSPP